MSERCPTKTWSERDIDRMLEAMEVIETPDFRIATWPHREPLQEDGKTVHPWPYPTYHPVVDQLWKLCYETSAYVDPYAILPEDPPGLERGTGTVGVLSCARDIESASLDQIRRYLVLCTRGERFCDGYTAEQFEEGCLPAAIRRLRALREAIE